MPTVMIAEDNLDLRKLYERQLRGAGYEVISFPDGWQALDEIKKRQSDGNIDLLITDVCMPILNGIALIGQMAYMGITLPVIINSTFDVKPSELSYSGKLDFLPKAQGVVLLEKVKEILEPYLPPVHARVV